MRRLGQQAWRLWTARSDGSFERMACFLIIPALWILSERIRRSQAGLSPEQSTLSKKQAQWAVMDQEATVHIVPIDDLVEHDLDGLECMCGPEVDFSGERPMVSHASLDRREDGEEA